MRAYIIPVSVPIRTRITRHYIAKPTYMQEIEGQSGLDSLSRSRRSIGSLIRGTRRSVDRCIVDARSLSHVLGRNSLRRRSKYGSGGGSLAVLPGLEAEGFVLDVADAEDEDEEEDGAEEEVENAVPDHLGGGRDDVGTLRTGPGNRIEEREEDDEPRTADVARAHAVAGVEPGAGAVSEKDGPRESSVQVMVHTAD